MFFFICGRFSTAGKLPKWPKIPFQYPLALRHPKILEKCRKHHRILVSVRNRFWPPPPPAKADIATAILTNVIEHLVLLLPPNKHAFTAKAVWADFWGGRWCKSCHLDWSMIRWVSTMYSLTSWQKTTESVVLRGNPGGKSELWPIIHFKHVEMLSIPLWNKGNRYIYIYILT